MRTKEETKRLLDNFDLDLWISDEGIEVSDTGDNVSTGWYGMPCVFCNDHSNHLGINRTTKTISCYLCGTTGTIIKLIKQLKGCPLPVAYSVLERYQNYLLTSNQGPDEEAQPSKAKERRRILPDGFERIIEGDEPLLVKSFLKRRGFPLSICQDYRLGYVRYGKFMNRIIAPAYLEGKIVSFQAIATVDARVPYIDCSKDKALIHNKKMLYGIDEVGEQVIIVEGYLDKWAMGKDAVALTTKNFSPEQLSLLRVYGRGKKVKILLDSDAAKSARALLEKHLAAFFPSVLCIELDEGDPDDLSKRDILSILAL